MAAVPVASAMELLSTDKVTVGSVSSLFKVTVAPSVISTAKLVAAKLPWLTVTVSFVSNLVSPVGVMVKVCVSPAVPVKVKVWPVTAI